MVVLVIWAVGALGASPSLEARAVDEGASEAHAGDPESTAREYLDAVEAMDWVRVVVFAHPEALASFRRYVDAVVLPDDGEGALQAVTGVESEAEYGELDDAAVMIRAFQAMERDAPGIVNAFVDRTTRVLGVVEEAERSMDEGSDPFTFNHVVYRRQWGLDGARSEIRVLTLAQDDQEEWRVLEADELDTLRPGLRATLVRVRGEVE